MLALRLKRVDNFSAFKRGAIGKWQVSLEAATLSGSARLGRGPPGPERRKAASRNQLRPKRRQGPDAAVAAAPPQ